MDIAFGKVADVAVRHSTGGVYSKATVHLGIDPLAEKELLWIAQVRCSGYIQASFSLPSRLQTLYAFECGDRV